jgi:hypothetical protein
MYDDSGEGLDVESLTLAALRRLYERLKRLREMGAITPSQLWDLSIAARAIEERTGEKAPT